MSTVSTAAGIAKIEEYLGADARNLLDYTCKGIPKASLHLPGPRWVDDIHAGSDRPTPVLRSLQTLLDHHTLLPPTAPSVWLDSPSPRTVSRPSH